MTDDGMRAELDKAPADVAAMFDRVAARYDLVNDLLALGQTRIWRSMVVNAVDPKPGQQILDLAAGTGTSSAPFAKRGAYVVPCDFSLGMLAVGKQRQPDLPFVAGDAMNPSSSLFTANFSSLSPGFTTVVAPCWLQKKRWPSAKTGDAEYSPSSRSLQIVAPLFASRHVRMPPSEIT